MANHLFDGLLGGRENDPAMLLRIPGSADWNYADTVPASGRLANLLRSGGCIALAPALVARSGHST